MRGSRLGVIGGKRDAQSLPPTIQRERVAQGIRPAHLGSLPLFELRSNSVDFVAIEQAGRRHPDDLGLALGPLDHDFAVVRLVRRMPRATKPKTPLGAEDAHAV